MTALNWNSIVDRSNERLEFGACHVNQAWRRHKTPQSKFMGLVSAFETSSHRLPLLLQAVDANFNARNHPERGQALFAAVWFQTSSWAILCDQTHATIVQRLIVDRIPEKQIRDDEMVFALRTTFDATENSLRKQLNENFFDQVLRKR